MNLLRSNFRRPTPAEAVLFGVLLLTGTVDAARGVSFGGVTGLGATTLLVCGAAWAVWLLRPTLPLDLLKILFPLFALQLYALGSLLWFSPATNGYQLLALGLAFLGLIVLTAREVDHDPAMAHRLHDALLGSSVVAVGLYCLVILQKGMGEDGYVNCRPFALYAMIAVATAAARWRGGPTPNARRLALLWVVVVIGVVFLSMSRTALVCAALLVPLVVVLRGNRRSVLLSAAILAAGGAAFAVALYTYQPLYHRFFGDDASLNVGGVAINGEGRAHMWTVVLNNLGDDWVFGKGISASEKLIDEYFVNLGQPHNDYLRYYYDLGILGLGMWLAFVAGFVARTLANLRRSIRNRAADYPLHLAALLALAAVSLSMGTDNDVSYSFVMMPLAILIGCSLGGGRAAARAARELRPRAGFAPAQLSDDPRGLPHSPFSPA